MRSSCIDSILLLNFSPVLSLRKSLIDFWYRNIIVAGLTNVSKMMLDLICCKRY